MRQAHVQTPKHDAQHDLLYVGSHRQHNVGRDDGDESENDRSGPAETIGQQAGGIG